MEKIQIGDYVLATQWSDGNPKEHWVIGFVKGFIDSRNGIRYNVVDNEGNSFRGDGFRRVKKISANRGEWLLKYKDKIELFDKSLWWWVRQNMIKIDNYFKEEIKS